MTRDADEHYELREIDATRVPRCTCRKCLRPAATAVLIAQLEDLSARVERVRAELPRRG